MPIHDARHVEYAIDSGHISIMRSSGQRVPAYWAHPRLGVKFSGILLLHDWWGMNTVARLLASFYATMGYYVIAPDLFDGKRATTPKEAMQRLEESQKSRYATVDAALSVLETHNRINDSVGVIGLGMGGTLALEAAIKRDDLEAAVAYAGFPQQFLGQFGLANTPILACYGSNEPYTKPVVIKALQDELASTPLADKHRVLVVPGAGHEFFHDTPGLVNREHGKIVVEQTMSFLEAHLIQPTQAPRQVY